MTDLTALRRANVERQALWCPDPDEQPDMMFRATELGGEVGEAGTRHAAAITNSTDTEA